MDTQKYGAVGKLDVKPATCILIWFNFMSYLEKKSRPCLQEELSILESRYPKGKKLEGSRAGGQVLVDYQLHMSWQ